MYTVRSAGTRLGSEGIKTKPIATTSADTSSVSKNGFRRPSILFSNMPLIMSLGFSWFNYLKTKDSNAQKDIVTREKNKQTKESFVISAERLKN